MSVRSVSPSEGNLIFFFFFFFFLKLTDLTDAEVAVKEFRNLIHDLDEAGLRTQVRLGPGVSSLLVFVRVPREDLGKMIHESR